MTTMLQNKMVAAVGKIEIPTLPPTPIAVVQWFDNELKTWLDAAFFNEAVLGFTVKYRASKPNPYRVTRLYPETGEAREAREREDRYVPDHEDREYRQPDRSTEAGREDPDVT